MRHGRRGFGKRAKNAAGVEPAGAVPAEDGVPIDLAGLELRDGGVAAVGTSQRRARAESALGEVQPVAHRAADSVEWHPAYQRLVDAALVDQVLDQPPDRVIGESGDDRRIETEAALEAARDVIFAAALVNVETAGRGHPLVAGIEAQHHLAQRHQVPAAILFRFDRQWHGVLNR